jgi:hypothetical protein
MVVELYRWVEGLRRRMPLALAIAEVAERMRSLEGDDHHYTLGSQLAFLLHEAGRDEEALHLLDDLMRQHPENVLPAMRKAGMYLYNLDQPEEALRWINVALERANRTKFFRREVLGDKARILLKLGRGDELSDVLEEIMSLQMVKGIPDVGRERDFVDRAPPGFIRKNVLDRYNEFRPRRPDDSLADEPPKYSSPDDAM